MFQPTREQARRFFFDAWRQYREGTALSPLQRMALEVMLLHPEYHAMLEQPDGYVERDYTPESGAMNPFCICLCTSRSTSSCRWTGRRGCGRHSTRWRRAKPTAIDDGAFHTTGLKVTERLSMDGDKIIYQAIADDPAVLAEPWHMPARKLKRSAEPLSEPLPCIEQDLDHVVDGTHHDNAR